MPNAPSRIAFACRNCSPDVLGRRRGAVAAMLPLVAAFLLAGTILARADSCATTYDQVLETARGLAAENPGVTFVDYAGEDARKIVAAMNAIEPVSDWTAEHIIVIDPDGEQPFRVGIVDKGCMTHAFPIPREAWFALLKDALGDRS